MCQAFIYICELYYYAWLISHLCKLFLYSGCERWSSKGPPSQLPNPLYIICRVNVFMHCGWRIAIDSILNIVWIFSIDPLVLHCSHTKDCYFVLAIVLWIYELDLNLYFVNEIHSCSLLNDYMGFGSICLMVFIFT